MVQLALKHFAGLGAGLSIYAVLPVEVIESPVGGTVTVLGKFFNAAKLPDIVAPVKSKIGISLS